MKIILGTKNENKVKEFTEIIKSLDKKYEDAEILPAPEFFEEPEENSTDLYQNAIYKVEAYYKQAKEHKLEFDMIISEDFGFIVDKDPLLTCNGVKSKRILQTELGQEFLQKNSLEDTEKTRNQFLVDLHFGSDCTYISAISAVFEKDGEPYNAVGVGYSKGKIVKPRGTNGFAFDFIAQHESGKTYSEMTPQEKRDNGSRLQALKSLMLEI